MVAYCCWTSAGVIGRQQDGGSAALLADQCLQQAIGTYNVLYVLCVLSSAAFAKTWNMRRVQASRDFALRTRGKARDTKACQPGETVIYICWVCQVEATRR